MKRLFKRWEERQVARYLRECLGKSDPPPAPNYQAQAQAQGQANVDTAKVTGQINNPNIYTPYGQQNVSWSQNPDKQVFDQSGYDQAMQTYRAQQGTVGGNPYAFDASGNPVDNNGNRISGTGGNMPAPSMNDFFRTVPGGQGNQATVTQTLSPQEQQIFNSQEAIKQSLANQAQTQLGRVSQSMNSPFDTSKLAPQVTGIGNQNWANAPQGGPVQGKLDYSGAPGMPQADNATREAVTNALYGQATSRLDPRFNVAEDQLRTSLANSGHSQGDKGYGAAVDEFTRGKNDAYTSAMNTAISGGTDAMQKLYGMQLQGRQQGVTEANTQGAFANQAQNQQFGQAIQGATFQNQTAQNKVAEAMNNANLSNTGRQQQISEQAYLRNLPLNELNSLRTGAPVQAPSFQPYTGVNIAPPPIYQAGQDAGNYATDVYNVKAGQQSQQNAALGTAAMAAMYFF